jgi:hypothetical protein
LIVFFRLRQKRSSGDQTRLSFVARRRYRIDVRRLPRGQIAG